MDQLMTTIYLFGALLTTLFLGVHVAFALGGISIAFIYVYLGPGALGVIPLRAFRSATAFEYTAIPLFIFMASMLQHSGIAERLFSAMHALFGKLRGGLAAGTIGVATIFAAMSGISGAATISMGMIAVPAMLKRGYSKQIALGSVAAGGSLGILIPPSVTMIVYGVTSGTSIGRLYSAGLLPGLLIAGLFVVYVLFFSWLRKEKVAAETDAPVATASTYIVGFFAPMALIIVVLGSIMIGFASIGEAAALGAAGAAIFAFSLHRKTFWKEILPETCTETLKYTCMIFWIIILASAFSTFYTAIGASRFIESMVMDLELNRYVIFAIMMVILLMLGMVLDTVGIILITLPIFAPIANSLGFDPVWFGILYIINMEIGFLTPPFGYNLFYLKGVAPNGVTMVDIYKSVIPFILLMLVGIVICAAFPSIILVLPNLLFG
ncbi:TRAP transporter large permease subunit [Roseovarius pacificus]|uniref:TRAP transporter large permease n=1 Tax=Roseovarius pacificus TaxID=337701 RepID=UPI002A186DCD|nr:TRAP transporter large permease subunit [Roseovarius pacificus]